MAVSNILLKTIIRKCCRTLSYVEEEHFFTFPFYPYISDIWDNIRGEIHSEFPEFYLKDFNNILHNLSDIDNLCERNEVSQIADSLILNGEVLEIFLGGKIHPLRLVKMKDGQYLNVNTGNGYVFGTKSEFSKESLLVTSDGKNLGKIKSISLLYLSCEHIVLSKLFIGNYFNNKVSDSLWPIFEKVVKDGHPNSDTDLSIYLTLAKQMGINSYTLINILNAGSHLWR
ncbi:hypothetical protein AAH082_18695 [Phocaeicola vulgatus]|uniref:hypothetical protein n=1 Tax=Bacteroidaceae TaxID=815 RepID=UPI0039B69D6D